MDIPTSKTGMGTKLLQFDVCCKAIDQNFNYGYSSLHSQKGVTYTNLHLLASQKNILMPGLPSLYLKTWLSKVNATIPFESFLYTKCNV